MRVMSKFGKSKSFGKFEVKLSCLLGGREEEEEMREDRGEERSV